MFHVERMEMLKNCPVCGSTDFKHYKTCTDHTVSKKSFEIVFCTACGFKFTNPRPNADEIGVYYDSPDYISHSNSKKGLFNLIYQNIREISLKKKLGWINALKPEGKRLLDIGCGTGEFLNAAKKGGYDVIGIEPSAAARKMGIENYGLDIFEESHLNSLQNESFNVVTMWHVLEHVHHLQERVKKIHQLLKKGGYAIIAVPNYTSRDAHHYGALWAAYDVPRHLYHFSPDVIKKLFAQHQFDHQKSIPMTFDSYYVSLLSSKYRNDAFPPITGFINGLRSNLHAKGDPERYSSVVYIFKKTT